MTRDENTRAILSKGDEDFAGVWEIPALLHSGHENPIVFAQRLVRDLRADGLVELVWGEPNPLIDTPLNDAEFEQILREQSWWNGEQPFAGRQVWLYTNDAGVRVLSEADG